MQKLSVILSLLSLYELNFAHKSSNEESAEQHEPQWVDNPETELPENLIICSRYSPEKDDCIKKSMIAVMPSFKDGYPKLGIAPFDPLLVKKAYFEYKQSDLLATLTAKNTKVHGMSRAEVLEVRSNLTDTSLDLELDIRFPKVLMDGSYKGEGRINDYKLKSRGSFNVTCSNVLNTWKMSAQIENRNGEDYMKVRSINVIATVGYLKVYASGISPDPVLNKFALDFINEYWSYFYQPMIRDTRKSWEPILVNAINQVFNRVPFRRLISSEINNNNNTM